MMRMNRDNIRITRIELQQEGMHLQQELQEKEKLAMKFESDKALLQERYEFIEQSSLEREEKQLQLQLLDQALERLEMEYTQEVDQKVLDLQQEADDVSGIYLERETIMEEHENQLRGVRFSASQEDLVNVADEVRAQREEYQKERGLLEDDIRMRVMKIKNIKYYNIRG